MKLLKRFGEWLERVTTPPARPAPPSILNDPNVSRTYFLLGNGSTGSSWSTTEWPDVLSHSLEDFVVIFNDYGRWGTYPPYVQFYAKGTLCAAYTAGTPGYDALGTFSSGARGKIRPMRGGNSSVVINDDGSATFTNVAMEFTAGIFADVPLNVPEVTITSSGALIVTE